MPSLTEQATAIVLKVIKPGMAAAEVTALYEAVFQSLLKCAQLEPAAPAGLKKKRSLSPETIARIRKEVYGLDDPPTPARESPPPPDIPATPPPPHE